MKRTKSEGSRWVVAAQRETFEADVFQSSHERVVVLDFWAAWCGPCRALGPILEKLADEYEGRFLLVKANTDELPDAAAQFNVQGIPALFAVHAGQIVDYFTGALPEPQVRAWLDRVLQIQALAEAQRTEETDPAAAEQQYRALLARTPQLADAKVGLARALLAQRQLAASRAVIEELQQRGFLEPEAEKVKAALDLSASDGEDLAARRASAEAQPDNLELQLQLAESLARAQKFDEALEKCLSLVERDRKGVGERARQLMIDVFRVLPDDSPLTSTYRRRLSMALF